MFDKAEKAASEVVAQDGSKWYAVTVKPQHEKAVAKALSYKRFTEFLPVYQERRRWSDRMKVVETPLFPGYVFGRFPLDRRAAVLSTPGVRSIVSFGSRPEPIPEGEIAAVQAIVGSGLPVRPWPYWREGEFVMIVSGPLRGLTGCIACVNQSHQVVVSVDLLRRSVAVTVDGSSVVSVGKAVDSAVTAGAR